jgi:alkaline phosphatase D
MERYTHTRSIPEIQELLASCNHFAVWDDHEFGPNDADGSWIHKDWSLEAFKTFWANPSYGYPDLPGIMSAFTYMDADFILMDNRYNRTPDYEVGEKHIFGSKQVEYLIGVLKSSKAPFKFVVTGGQFLNTAQVFENHANFEKERSYILKRIEEENIRGVIFLTGDRHHSEVMKHKLANGNMVHEFTVSPLTARANSKVDEMNKNRIKGSLIQQRNFAVMYFSGAFRERVLTVEYYNSEGETVYKYSISD